MDYLAAISRFASAAENYCSWLENEPGLAKEEHYTATRLVAELYAAALFLPDAEPTADDAPSLTREQRDVIAQRLRSFPFQYYWEIFEPIVDKPDEAVCGDIADDLADIYFEIKEGLLAYPENQQCAVWHWRNTFGFHWGRHATSALRALHTYDPETAGEC